MMSAIIRILMGCIGSLGFGILFNVRGKFLILSTLGGLISISGYELLVSAGLGDMVSCFIMASLITLYSEFLARIVKTPTTTFIMSSLIPLVPGGALYYAMSNGLEKKWDLCFKNAYYASKIGLALSVGIILITTIIQMYFLLISANSHKRL